MLYVKLNFTEEILNLDVVPTAKYNDNQTQNWKKKVKIKYSLKNWLLCVQVVVQLSGMSRRVLAS